jgi:hypothetical protein
MKPAADSAWHLVLGLSVWALWFVVAYGGAAAVCRWAPPDPAQGAMTLLNAALLFVGLAVAALLAGLAWRCGLAARRAQDGREAPHRRFLAHAGAVLHAIAAMSTLVVALPLLLLPPCL